MIFMLTVLSFAEARFLQSQTLEPCKDWCQSACCNGCDGDDCTPQTCGHETSAPKSCSAVCACSITLSPSKSPTPAGFPASPTPAGIPASPTKLPTLDPSHSPSSQSSNNSSGLSAGDDAGIAIAVIVSALFLLAIAWHRNRKRQNDAQNDSSKPLGQPLLGTGAGQDVEIEMKEQETARPVPAAAAQVSATSDDMSQEVFESARASQQMLFDPHSGVPLTDAARRLIVKDWKIASSDKDGEEAPTASSYRLAYQDLFDGSDGFAKDNLLGEGGSCAVYRASVYGYPVAVKVIKKRKESTVPSKKATEKERKQREYDNRQFFSEMKLLMRVQHPNICRLLACSFDGPTRCLVLELMEGGNLEQRLTEPSLSQSMPGMGMGMAAAVAMPDKPGGTGAFEPPPPPLSWQQRLQVLVAVARALKCLHSMDPPVVHRDVKPANVLLAKVAHARMRTVDMCTVTKVADFGTARENTKERHDRDAKEGEGYAVTQLILGTVPHMPPEYMLRGRVSERLDAFAFGMVVVETMTNLDAVNARQFCDAQYEAGMLVKALQKSPGVLRTQWPPESIEILAGVAERCMQAAVTSRSTVVEELPIIEGLFQKA